MPILPDFKWRESEAWVKIDVELRTVNPATADITTTECFVKVNSYPFLYQVDLEGEIDTNESTGVVDKTGVHFHLIKVVSNTQSTYCYLNLRTLQSGHQLIK